MERYQQYRRIAGVDTSVYDERPPTGNSSTIVMVHGGDPRSLSNALDWSTIWNPEILDARLIAYDKPGQGRSYVEAMDASLVSADAISRHLEELVAGATWPVILMGHSRGALPVADVALRRPELVQGVVLVASNTLAPASVETPKDFYGRAYADPPIALNDEFVRREPEMNSFSPDHIDAGFVDGRRHAALESGWWSDREHRIRAYDTVTQPSLQHMRTRCLAALHGHGFSMPVLQVWGYNDVSAPVDLAQNLFELVASGTGAATSVVVNRSGHYVYREHASQFVGLLGDFCRRLAQ